MAARPNMKALLASGQESLGCWLNMGSPVSAEIIGHAGFDWALIDGEHAPWDPGAIIAQMRALESAPLATMLRVPVSEPWIIKQALDWGARALLIPMIDDAAAARAAVAACRFAPQGVRGVGYMVARASLYGADATYGPRANDEICVIVQAESARALENIEEIAAVEGVDGIFIGPADLAADLGHPHDPAAPEVRAAIEGALARIAATGTPAGIMATDPAEIARWREAGARLFGAAADVALLRDMAASHLAALRGALGRS